MTQPSYHSNGREVSADVFYAQACDPRRSVVIEACAGAGKTWMLVSRILRAWLDGAEPGQILAITFTRKAAGEMRERLAQWLQAFARATHDERCAELRARGVPAADVDALAPRLQALHAQWLSSGEFPRISTIHGWFSRLVRGLPLDTLQALGLPPRLQLIEDLDELWPQLWARFLRSLDATEPGAPLRAAFESIVVDEGRNNLEGWLRSAIDNRLELHLADAAGTLWSAVPPAAESVPGFEDLVQPLEALERVAVVSQLAELARELGRAKGVTAQGAAAALVDLAQQPDLKLRLEGLCQALLTKAGTPRQRMGYQGPLLDWAQQWVQDLLRAQRQQQASEQHRAMVLLSTHLFAQYATLKRDSGQVDIVDLELAAAHLHADPALAGWVQERLDLQLRHVLMDEFQDTSPLQWSTLHQWLSAYAGAGGGTSGQQGVSLFVVGDPKQSIYRFRRADPRVFAAARDFVIDVMNGDALACDHTRRNAPGIIELLNRALAPAAAQGAFVGFRPHTTASAEPHRIRILPDVMRPPKDADGVQAGPPVWRDTLQVPRHERATVARQAEAAHCADAIAHLLSHEHKAPGEIFVLGRKRASLAHVAEALAARGIAHVAPESTRLVDTPEAQDLLAVVEAVVTRSHDLALARSLRCPAFAADDRVLSAVARAKVESSQGARSTWWDVLMGLQPEGDTRLTPSDHAVIARAQALLPRWAQASRVLPPHDLMQQIADESGWRDTLARLLPAPRLRQALSHLDAVLGQALALHGGRDATPYRWLRELRRLIAPLPAAAVDGAVQLLTIHGAKGLEADVVFLIDLDGEAPRTDHHTVLVDWPQGADHPAGCAFVARMGQVPASLEALCERERQANRTEEFNALYVALTRAKRELIFSRTEPHRPHPEGSWWAHLSNVAAVLDDDWRWCPPPPQDGHDVIGTLNTLNVLPALVPATVGRDRRVSVSAADGLQAHRGKVLHRALELITPLALAVRSRERIAAAVTQAWHGVDTGRDARPPLDDAETRRLVDQLQQILTHPASQDWLQPQGHAWAGNELVVWHEGQPLRLDRLVARDGEAGRTWWVIDYKLHESPESVPAYREQMQRYVRAVGALQPGDIVRAAFVTGDGSWIPLPPG